MEETWMGCTSGKNKRYALVYIFVGKARTNRRTGRTGCRRGYSVEMEKLLVCGVDSLAEHSVKRQLL
jgi:hypothetical protein